MGAFVSEKTSSPRFGTRLVLASAIALPRRKSVARGSGEIESRGRFAGKSARVVGAEHDPQLAGRHCGGAPARGAKFGVMESKRRSTGARTRAVKHRMVALCCEQLFRSVALDGGVRRVVPETWLGEVNHARSCCRRANASGVGRCRAH